MLYQLSYTRVQPGFYPAQDLLPVGISITDEPNGRRHERAVGDRSKAYDRWERRPKVGTSREGQGSRSPRPSLGSTYAGTDAPS